MYIIKKRYLSSGDDITVGIFSNDKSAFNNYLRHCADNRIWVGATFLYEKINSKEVLISSFNIQENKRDQRQVKKVLAMVASLITLN